MMNGLALGLVLTSLITAGFFTPTPETKKPPKENVIFKEGHRFVVVEFENDDKHTKVLISPPDSEKPTDAALSKTKDKEEKTTHEHGFNPKELVCDAYGKCMRKISTAFEKTKEEVAGKAHVAEDKAREVEEETKEVMTEAMKRVKDVAGQVFDKMPHSKEEVAGKAHAAAGKAREVEEETKGVMTEAVKKVKDVAGRTAHQVFDKMHDSKEEVAGKAHVAVDKAREVEEGTKGEMTEAVKKVKDVAGQTAHQVFDKMPHSKESVEEARDQAGEIEEGAEEIKEEVEIEEGAEEIKEEVEEKASEKMEGAKQAPNREEKELSEILHRGRDVGVDAFHYAFSPERMAALSGVLHLMGFASAYGTCVWVTFASSSVLAGALPRNQFAVVQSKIYPVYFKAMAYSLGMAILGQLMGRGLKSGFGMFRGFNLMASLVMILVNLFYLEPRATKVMLERMKKEKEEGRGKEGHVTESSGATEMAGRGGFSTAEVGGRLEKQQKEKAAAAKANSEMVRLSDKLQKLNAYSSFLNVLSLMSLTWHLVQLGQRVNVAACV